MKIDGKDVEMGKGWCVFRLEWHREGWFPLMATVRPKRSEAIKALGLDGLDYRSLRRLGLLKTCRVWVELTNDED